jgi:cyclophilin family peptidyl-prolyl cis-trans isomerase
MIRAILFLLCLSGLVLVKASAQEAGLQTFANEKVLFHTNVGDIVAALYPHAAPQHYAQILRLVQAGVYTGATIFRIEPGFVAQVDSYNSRQIPLTPEQLAIISKIPAEFTAILHRRGILSMARYDENRDSAETSFSFMLGDAPHLNGNYTVIGEIVSGLDVLAVIESIPVDTNHKPLQDLSIVRAEIVTDEQLSHMHLVGPMAPVNPDAPYQLAFKIFAALAFILTVSIPLVKIFLAARAKKTGVS